MSKITIKERISASMLVDNSADDGRAYDISAKIKCTKTGVESVFDGVVHEGEQGQTVAVFNGYGAELSINFTAAEGRPVILSAVTQFINNVKSEDYDI